MSSRIKKTFKELNLKGKSAFIPYITAGDPDIDLSPVGSYNTLSAATIGT